MMQSDEHEGGEGACDHHVDAHVVEDLEDLRCFEEVVRIVRIVDDGDGDDEKMVMVKIKC